MIRKIISALALLALSHTASAGLITHNGYTLNTDTNIVSNGTLEWLQWDLTESVSIDSALALYGTEGWDLASNVQMANLLTDFSDFTKLQGTAYGTAYDTDEKSTQLMYFANDYNVEDIDTDLQLQFHALFGVTSGTVNTNNRQMFSNALFGKDLDANSRYNDVWIADDYQSGYSNYSDQVRLYNDSRRADRSYTGFGVALVRAAPTQSINVPEPSTLAIMCLGLLGLVRLRTK